MFHCVSQIHKNKDREKGMVYMQQTIRKIIAMSMSIVMLFATLYFVPVEEAKGATSTTFIYDGTNGSSYNGEKYLIVQADIPDDANYFRNNAGLEQVTVQSGMCPSASCKRYRFGSRALPGKPSGTFEG